MVKRYELSKTQWDRIKDMLPGKATDRGVTAQDNRAFVNGVLWVLRSCARWSDLPEGYGRKWERAQALHALGQGGHLGARLRGFGEGRRQWLHHAR